MATGIVSLAAHFALTDAIALPLFVFNVFCYVVLWAITLTRLSFFPRRLIDDLTHHARSVTFLTTVAGTMVLGSQFAILTPWILVAQALWFLGIVLWLILIYTFFASITMRLEKPAIQEGINGAWLLVTVSTESICVLGTLIAPSSAAPHLLYFISLCSYMVGALLYVIIITLVIYRWSFFSLSAEKLTPPYWINMGALAITTLAGARLILSAENMPLLAELAPFLKGCTLFFWAAAAWWVPLLIIVGAWRHGVKRVPLVYDPQYWSLVFPLGMFTVATFMLIRALDLPFLIAIPRFFVWISLAAWFVTFIGVLRTVVFTFTHRKSVT
jgi:tellurite resistance protein TehA-like permease